MTQSVLDARAVLRDCPLFRNLASEERNRLVARAQVHEFAAGATIFSIQAVCDSLMAVISGSVRISAPSPDGKEILLAILRPGEVFGEIALLDGKERSADAHAMTACNLAVLDRRDVLAFLDHHPEAWRGFVEVLCARLRRTDDHLVEVALLELPVRLAKTLLRSARTESVAVKGSKTVVRLSQREIGNIVGASRERVNHWVQGWQRSGFLRVERGTISIIDRAALERLAAQS